MSVLEAPARTAATVNRYSRISLGALWSGVAVAALLVVAPAFIGESSINQLTQFFSFLILAIGWNVLAGYGGMVSIGQQAYLGVASYAVLYLSLHGVLSWWAAPIAIAFCGVLSIPISYLAFRLRGSFFAIGSGTSVNGTLLDDSV